MNVSSTSALTRALNPLESPFLPTDDPRLLWLKYQILIYSEDGLKTVKVRPPVYEKSEKQKILYHQKSVKGFKINVNTALNQAYKVFDYEQSLD